ncbi:serine O-acetyltransferase [Megasphaera hutchinsoni]|uniref:Serine acetyltransferase n=1 Tax=Megasphaera hutchinsoni TaxID=1588748 RepID=A0A134CDZ2_9FIRM|nr:serine O-acetyltransferase [Megasphaera hutchinsoni]KXB90390.1 serine O-acetyltransferase [Megasphaera hutchinsoni]
MFTTLKKDIRVIQDRDPAAKSKVEIVLCYSGLHAIWLHRVSHFLYIHNHPVVARCIATFSRFFTGIEIHPGAILGEGLFIDHGMGTVIGETTIIGKNVTLYQGVTLGGTGKEKGKRHPTIGDYAVIACGAKVLGSFTVGEGAKIGAGSVVLREVPPHATVVGIPGHIVLRNPNAIVPHSGEAAVDLQHDHLPDPLEDELQALTQQLQQLRQKMLQQHEKPNPISYTHNAKNV